MSGVYGQHSVGDARMLEAPIRLQFSHNYFLTLHVLHSVMCKKNDIFRKSDQRHCCPMISQSFVFLAVQHSKHSSGSFLTPAVTICSGQQWATKGLTTNYVIIPLVHGILAIVTSRKSPRITSAHETKWNVV